MVWKANTTALKTQFDTLLKRRLVLAKQAFIHQGCVTQCGAEAQESRKVSGAGLSQVMCCHGEESELQSWTTWI